MTESQAYLALSAGAESMEGGDAAATGPQVSGHRWSSPSFAWREGRAEPEQLFDIVTGDGAVVRNFCIAPGLSPSSLPGVIVSGGAKADLTLYEFFDYACPFCRTASEELEVLLQPGGGVRLGLVQHSVLLSARTTSRAWVWLRRNIRR